MKKKISVAATNVVNRGTYEHSVQLEFFAVFAG